MNARRKEIMRQMDIIEAAQKKIATLQAEDDEAYGYADRTSGFYDKWYRYNRKDDGSAYDRGVLRAVNSGKCAESFTLIECR